MVDHLPAQLQSHGGNLDLLRRGLLHAYRSAELNPDIINKAAFNPRLYEILAAVFCRLRDDPGSLAACLNEPNKQIMAGEHEEVDKSLGGVESSPLTRKRKRVEQTDLDEQ